MKKILIVGAGPTGLTAAVELARRGVIADVIEKRPGPSQLSRAVGILPASMNILEPSGVAEKIRDEAIAYDQVILHSGDREVARISLHNNDSKKRLWGLAQDRTEFHLAKTFTAMGGKIRYDTPLKDLDSTKERCLAHFSDKTVCYDAVVGADGVRSTVRQTLNIAYNGYELDGEWSIADVQVNNWSEPTSFKIYQVKDGGVVIVAPMEADRFRIVSNRSDALATLPVKMDVANIRRTSAFKISIRQVPEYSRNHVYLAGDAAHCHSPAGGRGMNMGIADAAELANRLIDGTVDGYHDARHPEGKATIAFTERARKIVTSTSPITRLLLQTASKAAGRFDPVGKLMVRQLLE
jgi:2-polyprenyl-6-methoxyphenol hydroxylase-like FAD-dependent oxidoreductase